MKDQGSCYEILLNYHCNAACSFCSQGNFDKSLNAPFELIAKEIYLAKKNGFTRLGFSGGEPTADKNILKAVKLAKSVGFKFIRIQTNGIRLKDYSFCRSLAKAGLTFCKFSFTNDDAVLHDSLTGVLGSWASAFKGLENMKRLKVRLGNNIVINRYNYNRLKDIIEYFLKKGISNFVVIYPIYTGSMSKNAAKLGVSLPDCAPYFMQALRFMSSIDMAGEILFLNVPPCFLPGYESNAIGGDKFNTLVADPGGAVTDLDKSADLNKKKGKPCKKCFLKSKCPGVDAGYLKVFGWKGFKPALKREKNKIKGESVYYTDNERCMIEILKKKGPSTTSEILKESQKMAICKDCSDGNSVIAAGEKLIRKKIAAKEFKKGVYIWRLTGKYDAFES
ncbi:MAG: radical SAM protein [Elusimicrobia bacterium]|nr:radical SAM protein [Elusimicrobiota bacterium]